MDNENSSQPPPGSDLYYALLYLAKAQAKQLATLHALKVELCTIPVSVSDVGVARVKLEWWRLEAERLTAGEPRHLLTRTYLDNYGADGSVGNALAALVSGLDGELGGRRLATREEQFAWFDTTFGPLYALQASILARDEEITPEHWQYLGRWIEIGYALLNLKPLAVHNLRRIPTENLVACGCTWDDIDGGRPSVHVAELVKRECDVAIANIAELIASTPKKARRIQQPLFTLGCIVQNALIELTADGCRIWQHRIELTALRKLWLAWRMRFF